MQLPCRRLRRPRRVLRHGPAASCSAPMASRVSVSGTPGDASPARATASLATTGPASIKDFSGPVAPRESSDGLAKPPHCRVRMSLTAISYGPAHPSIRPRRLKCGDMAHPCRRGASPHAIRDTGASESRGTSASAATSYGRRANAGFPPTVRLPGLIEMAPDPPPQGGPKRPGIYTWHQSGTRKECLAALPPLAATPI